jgi:hypothetical protein
MPIKHTGGGAFDPQEGNTYFLASNIGPLTYGALAYEHLLIAVNEISSKDIPTIEGWMAEGKKVFIDSGVFWLTQEHKKKHGISMDEALGLAPEQIDGFDQLFDKYVSTVSRLEANCWGYIELDQGGMHNKIRTRARLEDMGLCPIPVYHPFNDGWDYFDYLAENYDRICFGNVVQASSTERLRLVATAWERKRRYPNLWIHLLGYTPNETLYALPISSGDSSSWLTAVRWSGYRPQVCNKALPPLSRGYSYRLGSDAEGETGHRKATTLAAYGCELNLQNWRSHMAAMNELGINPISPLEQSLDAARPTLPRQRR